MVGGCGSTSASGAPAPPAGPPKHGGTLTVSLSTEPAIINPWLAQGAMAVTTWLVDGTNDPLIELDPAGNWQPVLATRVPTAENGDVKVISPHEMTIDINLAPAASWSDGQPLTCADVAFTWKTVMNPAYSLSNRLGWQHITAIDCPTAQHVHIVMDGPYAMYRSRILALGPLPEHALKGKDFNTVWNDRVTVSSGPFLFQTWERGVKLVLVRNPKWWRAGPEKKPYLDRVIFRFTKDANTLKMQLRMTEADMAFIPADTNLSQELASIPDISYKVVPGAATEQLELQTGNAPLDNVHVRRALAYAIDRNLIARVVLKSQAPVAQQSTVPGLPVYVHDSWGQYHADPAKVITEMQAAGYTRSGSGMWQKNGKSFTLTWSAGAGSMPFRARIAQLVQEQLRRQGIAIRISLITPAVLYSDIAPQGKFHIGEWSEATGVEPAPSLIFGCDQIPVAPGWAGKNRFRWCNHDADALMRSADSVVDPAARAKVLEQVDTIAASEAVDLPLFRLPDVSAWNHRVQGFQPNPQTGHTWNMDEWWLSS